MITWSGTVIPTVSGINHCWEHTIHEHLAEVELVVPDIATEVEVKRYDVASYRRLFVGRKN